MILEMVDVGCLYLSAVNIGNGVYMGLCVSSTPMVNSLSSFAV